MFLFQNDPPHTGYWLAVLTFLVTIVQIAIVLAKKWWALALYAPAAAIWVLFLAAA